MIEIILRAMSHSTSLFEVVNKRMVATKLRFRQDLLYGLPNYNAMGRDRTGLLIQPTLFSVKRRIRGRSFTAKFSLSINRTRRSGAYRFRRLNSI
jgi:hypothetical protein